MKIIYKRLPRLHKRLMKNKLYFKYMHIVWNYGGLRAMIKSYEEKLIWYSKERERLVNKLIENNLEVY